MKVITAKRNGTSRRFGYNAKRGMMELVDTKYNAVLQGQGYRFTQRVGENLNNIIVKEDEEMWAIAGLTSCIIKVAKKGRDEELYKLGYYKVIKLYKINVYEERSNIF